jgi:site-specific DNA-methyltransferase (adenine-specific)
MESKFSNEDGLLLMKSMESNTVDLVLTDPPYIISKDSGMNRLFVSKDSTKEKYGDKYSIPTDYGEWDSQFTIDKINEFIVEFYRLLKPGGSCIIFFDLWKLESLSKLMIDAKFTKLRFIEWVKTNPVPINSKATYLSNSREIAISAVKGSGQTFNSEYDNGIYEYPIYQGKKGVDRIHPTQKSLPLFEELIKKHSNEGDIVLDPFGGSATTYLASLNTNRICISTELDLNYYSKAVDRLSYYKK